MSSRNMCLSPWAALRSDSEQLWSLIALLILNLVHYFLFCTNIIWRKKLGLRRKRSLPIFPAHLYVWKVRPRARPGPSCRPSGQPGGQAGWPAKRASLARRESATWRGNLKRELRSCRGLREKGSKQELPRSNPNLSPTFTYFIYKPRLLHSIKGS